MDSYTDIGQLLKRARAERRLSLEQIARTLHIRMHYLTLLETGNLGELPGLPYVKGYLQSYAAYIGLDKDEILRRFEAVKGIEENRNFYLPQSFHRNKKPGRPAVWGGVGVALAVYLLWAILRAPHAEISLIEHFPRKSLEKTAISADAPCIAPNANYYPPCTAARLKMPAGHKLAQDLARSFALRRP